MNPTMAASSGWSTLLNTSTAAEVWCLMLVVCSLSAASAAGFGDYPAHTTMPEVPTDPAAYESAWDPFVLRTSAGVPLRAQPESPSDVRVMAGFDAVPWNGRQIVRDAAGNWHVLIEADGGAIWLALGGGSPANPYRPRGGDLAAMALVGAEGEALLTGSGPARRASMAIDAANRLHVIWHGDDGLWHTEAGLAAGPEDLRRSEAWAAPRRLVERPCHHGDIMCGPDGNVVVSYATGDTVYYRSVSAAEPEVACAPGAGMPAMDRPGGRIPLSERESQDAVMDLAPDGSVYLAFRRDFGIRVARRTPAGQWLPSEPVAREYAFHPSIMIADGRPLVTFLHDGIRRIPLDLGEEINQRAGGGSTIGYATLTDAGWRTGSIVTAEEIAVFRRGMWANRGRGRIYPQIEQLGWPVLLRDRHGVVWALWMNTTRRWAFSARWLGEQFGQVHECRGPFNAPALPVNAEKRAPAGAPDVGLLFYAAAAGGHHRAIFDRLRVPSLSVAEDREVLFLDSLEVGATDGTDFVLNQMDKPSPYPALSPRGDQRVVWNGRVSKRGDTWVMSYTSPQEDGTNRPGWALSADGLHFEMVDALPEGLPEPAETPARPLAYWKGEPAYEPPPHYENPDPADPARRFIRLTYTTENRGTYSVEYSPDGERWGEPTVVSAVEAMREGGRPSFFDAADPERPIRIYSRVYTETGRSWGVIWSRDLMHWSGLEHLLDPDDPYGRAPSESEIGSTDKRYTMRGVVYMDSVAGKGEDEIYATSVRFAEGLYFCFYWPGRTGRPLTDVGLAVSRDGFNFTRVKNGERVLPVGPPGAWDSGYIFQMYPMLDGDTVRVYYRGTAGRREGTDGFEHNLTEIGLATIRVNGWTYYTPRAGRDRATITTIPIESPPEAGRRLAVNLEGNAGREGAFAVEVLDAATGEPFAGFGLADCAVPAEDGLAVPVSWRGGEALPSGRPIRLRFHLRAPAVRLYSFGFRDQAGAPR